MNTLSLKRRFEEEIQEIYSLSQATQLFYIFAERILGLNKIQIIKHFQKEILADDCLNFNRYISELKTGKPYQYVLGEAEFYGNLFYVNESVLIPRPETEELVDLIITNQKLKNNKKPLKILDIGTGSGCIAISLSQNLTVEKIDAIDFSHKALEIAKQNAEQNKVKINFIQKDYLKESLGNVYDIIVSNPPYIDVLEESEIENSVKKHEPTSALFAPQGSPLFFYEKIAQDCQKHLASGGNLYLEINQKLGNKTLALYNNVLSEAELRKDLSGNDRFILGAKY